MENKEFQLKLFGLFAEQAGTNSLLCSCLPKRDALLEAVFTQYPSWRSMPWALAVNHQLVFENQDLNSTDELAFMPPFSGG